jgi:hypothetical protein
MPTLHLTISGLCVFAFDQPLKGKGKDPTQATLLLQRLIQARELAHVTNGAKEVLDQHFPMLEFNPDDRDKIASTRGPDLLFAPDAKGDMQKGGCTLFGDDLTILIDGQPMRSNALQLTRTPPTNQYAPTDADKDTLWWMATLEDAFPGRGTVDPIFTRNPPGPNQKILARVVLSEGRLKTLDLSDDACTFVSPGSTTFNQRIATSFVLEVPFSKTVELSMNRPNGSKIETRRLVFSPAAGKDLQIAIKNMEIDPSIGVPRDYSSRATADFEVYAELLPGGGGTGPKPFPLPVGPGGITGAGLSRCPPSGG